MAEESGCPYTTWSTLDRLRLGVPKCKTKWVLSADNNTLCECGETQSPAHLLICRLLTETRTNSDLVLGQ